MLLHIFNPEHDLALAANLSNFTPPHAGRQLHKDLGYLPAIWADDRDYVLVEDVDDAQKAFARLTHRRFDGFVDRHQLSHININKVSPWGWDLALRSFLHRNGIKAELLPSDDAIGAIRDLSHRRHSADLLQTLTSQRSSRNMLTGFSCQEDSMQAVRQFLQKYHRIVVKAPWSSSGRGIRYIDGMISDNQERWIKNTIARQGSVMVEVYCNKVKDFGMEFESDGEGSVRFLGLSLFHTANGAYTGNAIISEEEKTEVISRYVPEELVESVKSEVCVLTGKLMKGKYSGPFGIDMMICASTEGFLLHPCVEINLRRTMGHVALELSKRIPSGYVMNINYTDNHYKLKISKL